jgi:hypothetical protein
MSREGLAYLPALAELRRSGGHLSRLRVTRPAYPCAGYGQLRIVAERDHPMSPEWVVAYEGYRRLPRLMARDGRQAP